MKWRVEEITCKPELIDEDAGQPAVAVTIRYTVQRDEVAVHVCEDVTLDAVALRILLDVFILLSRHIANVARLDHDRRRPLR